MVDKQIINGLKYEKLTEDQLHDLSQWELVDIVLAYRNDLQQILEEIREIAEKTLTIVDYKTYFARDNKSFKQEAFKALKQIQEKINEVIND